MLDERSDAASFAVFAEQLNEGNATAAEELLSRYSLRLIRVARTQLGRRLTTKSDPEDMVQSTFRTFYRRLQAGEVELRDWQSLSGYLSLLTLRRCQREAERFGTAARDVRREVSIGGSSQAVDLHIPDREPTPDEVGVFTDLLESLSDRLNERDNQVLRRLLEGRIASDIANELGCSNRTVHRSIAWIRQIVTSLESSDVPKNIGRVPL